MEVNKKFLSDFYGVNVRTIQNWQDQGMPIARGGGKGIEVLYDSVAVSAWHSARDATIENEKLRKELEEYRAAMESELRPGTIDYERHRLTRAQADAQELKNKQSEGTLINTGFCAFALSKLAMDLSSTLDSIPLSMQRQFPDLSPRQADHLKTLIAKAANQCAAAGEKIPGWIDDYIRTADE